MLLGRFEPFNLKRPHRSNLPRRLDEACRPQNLQASFTMYASEQPQSAIRGIPVLSG